MSIVAAGGNVTTVLLRVRRGESASRSVTWSDLMSRSSRSAGAVRWFHAVLSAVWGTLVWGLAGGAIARIAVVQVARGDGMGLIESVRFAARKGLALVGTPLCALLAVAFLAALCAVWGLVYRLPGSIGPIVGGVFAVFPLLAGLVMAIVLVGLSAGWPLMHATVAAEAEDGFDALSRSFAYVNQRPGRYALLVLLAWLLGTLGLLLLSTVRPPDGSPDPLGPGLHRALGIDHDALQRGRLGESREPGAARTLHAFWLGVVGLLVHAWIYAYFWTSATIIYLILRQDVDGTPWHAIAVPTAHAFTYSAAAGPPPPATVETAPAGDRPV